MDIYVFLNLHFLLVRLIASGSANFAKEKIFLVTPLHLTSLQALELLTVIFIFERKNKYVIAKLFVLLDTLQSRQRKYAILQLCDLIAPLLLILRLTIRMQSFIPLLSTISKP